MAAEDDPAIALLKAFGSAAVSIFDLIGSAADAASFGLYRSKRKAEERDLRKRLEAHLDTQTLNDDTARLIRNASFPAVDDYMESAYERFALEGQKQGLTHFPVHEIRARMFEALAVLYTAEGLTQPPLMKVVQGSIEAARYRDHLLVLARKTHDPAITIDIFTRALLASFIELTKSLPPMALDIDEEAPNIQGHRAHEMVPLIEVLPDIRATLNRMILSFFAPEIVELGLFANLRERLLENQKSATENKRDNFIKPEEFEGSSHELISVFLDGTPLKAIFLSPVPFTIPDGIRFEHHWIVAGSGHGKTQTLQTLIGRDLEAVAKGKASVVVLDSQGDLIKNVAGLKLFGKGQPLYGKLCLIDPTDIEFPVQLNLFSLGTERLDAYSKLDRERLLNSIIELYDFVLAALLGAEMTSKQSVIFRFVTRALLQIPNATVHTLLELMQPGGDQKYKEYISKLQGAASSFFANEFNSTQFAETKRQVLRRLYGVLENQTFERMFSHPKTKLDIFKELNSGKVILINAAKDLLKQNGTEVFGRFFIALIAQAAAERATLSPNHRLPTFVYIDECQDYIAADSNFTVILEQARKQKVGLIVAHQYLSQLSQSTLDSLHANTSIKFAGGVSDRDAHALARNMRTTPEFIESQTKLSFAAYVRNFTSNAVSLNIPAGHLEAKERMTDQEMAALRDQMRAQYAVPFAEAQKADNEPPAAPDKPEDFSDSY